MAIPVYVISLADSVERRESTVKQLGGLSVEFSLIDAVDGSLYTPDKVQGKSDFGIYRSGIHSRYLLGEEIGCSLSHLNLFKHIVAEEIELACILEDDNIYPADFAEVLYNAASNSTGWDILYLGHRSGSASREARCRNRKKFGQTRYFTGESVEVPYGSNGYIIKKNAAKLLLNNAFPIKMPFDSFIGNSPALGLRTHLISPRCVEIRKDFRSTIYKSQEAVYSSPIRKLAGRSLSRLYSILPFFRTLRVSIHLARTSLLTFLRRAGIIGNNYARL
jgi:glycosyl transferase, family 25